MTSNWNKSVQAAYHPACGSKVYVDFEQCERFEVSYRDDATLNISASKLLESKDYDQDHRDLLSPLGSANLILEHGYGEPPGWFTIVAVFPA